MSAALFFVVGAAMLGSALVTVGSKNLVRAVFWLALTLALTAALYGLLEAGFLAGVQVLTYVGGIVTLMIFGVMVTRRVDGGAIPSLSAGGARAAVVSALTFAAMAWAIVQSKLEEAAPAPVSMDASTLARQLLDEHLVAFEAASLLLLAATVGAVVLARRRDVAERPSAATIIESTRGSQP